MYRFRVPEIFLGCFLTVAVFAIGMLFDRQQAAQPQRDIPKQEAPNQSQKADSPDIELTGSSWLTKDASGFFTFWLALIGIGQAGLFFIQLRYMRKGMDDATIAAVAAKESADTAKTQAEVARGTLKTMQDTAERQLRAYVFVERAQIVNLIDGIGRPEAHVVIKNYGQTPAYELVNIIGLAIDEYPTPPTLNLTVNEDELVGGKAAMALGPGCESFSIAAPSTAPPVPPEVRAEFFNGTRIAFVYGKVRYKDVFGTERWTEYRLMIGGAAGVRGNQLVGCDEGNEAT
jgi:hypothetical protein